MTLPTVTRLARTQGDGRLDPLSRVLALAAIALGLYLYLGRLDGTPLQRGNEAMYASPPALMLVNGDYLVPRYQGDYFLDKPILPFWIIAASYRVLGVSIFAERLPSAIAGLASAVLLGLWVRSRAGHRAGLLAGIMLTFSPLFVFIGMTFAADAFLTLALLLAAIILDRAARCEAGSDAKWGALSGAALALAFGCKGLIGVVLPIGAVATTLIVDRRLPVRVWRRGAWTLVVLAAALTPWHWAMYRRLGKEFWVVFYWRNQFLRGTSHLYMLPDRSPLYYFSVLAWGLYPWSLLLPSSLFRRRPSSLPLGWLAFGLVFWSMLVMKREVYAVTLLPPAAALVAERAFENGSRKSRWQSLAWALAALIALAFVGIWSHAHGLLAAAAGQGVTAFLGVALAVLVTALAACGFKPKSSAAMFGAALACGVLCLAVRLADEKLGRFDPLPAWGARVRAECSEGCDGFLMGDETTSLEFYSGFAWQIVADPGLQIPTQMQHPKAFLVVRTSLEPLLADLPVKWEVLDRCSTFGSYSLDQLWGSKRGAQRALSLVRLEAR